jgi:hypothetical protein
MNMQNYTDMESASKYLKDNGHKDLQDWVNDESEHLKF